MLHKIKRGTTAKTLTVFVYDASQAAPTGLAGLTHATAGLTCRYKRSGDSTSTAVPLVGGTLGTWTSGKFMAIPGMPGLYEFDVPNEALASGEHVDILFAGAADMWCPPVKIELDALDYQDQVRAGLAAVPAAPVGSIGGMLVASSASNQVSVAGGGVRLAADGLDAISTADPGPAANMNTLSKMIVALWRAFYRKSEVSATALTRFADDGTTPNTTQTYADDGTTQKIGSAG